MCRPNSQRRQSYPRYSCVRLQTFCLLAQASLWLWLWPLWHWMPVLPALWALVLHLLTTPVWSCALTFRPSALRPFLCDPSATPPFLPPKGRVSLTRDASLLVERLTLEDEGWFECRILLLDREQDDFRNGTWTFLSITGAARRASGNASGAAFVAHRWHRPSLEQTQRGAWRCLWMPWQAEWNQHCCSVSAQSG